MPWKYAWYEGHSLHCHARCCFPQFAHDTLSLGQSFDAWSPAHCAHISRLLHAPWVCPHCWHLKHRVTWRLLSNGRTSNSWASTISPPRMALRCISWFGNPMIKDPRVFAGLSSASRICPVWRVWLCSHLILVICRPGETVREASQIAVARCVLSAPFSHATCTLSGTLGTSMR